MLERSVIFAEIDGGVLGLNAVGAKEKSECSGIQWDGSEEKSGLYPSTTV